MKNAEAWQASVCCFTFPVPIFCISNHIIPSSTFWPYEESMGPSPHNNRTDDSGSPSQSQSQTLSDRRPQLIHTKSQHHRVRHHTIPPFSFADSQSVHSSSSTPIALHGPSVSVPVQSIGRHSPRHIHSNPTRAHKDMI